MTFIVRSSAILCLIFALVLAQTEVAWSRGIEWSIIKNIENPNSGDQQTASLVLDIDKDGIEDFVITERTNSPSVVWYRYNGKTWDRMVIEKQPLRIEAGGTYLDIDEDGDLDVVFAGDSRSNQIWWWENPYPVYDQPWKRYLIKNHGSNKHHDQIFGDFDHDGRQELVSWNQHESGLYIFEIPEEPESAEVWQYAVIHSGSRRDEGLARADINLDGKMDIVGAGKWFEHKGGTEFTTHVIDKKMNFTRSAVGQLVEGGPMEVVFCPGDANGDIKWYEWKNHKWLSHTLEYVVHGHTLDIRDMDRDGNMDIFVGEMGNPGDGENADIMVWYGDGKGNFTKEIIRTGQGIHEGRLGDLNGDGTLDILVKPYNHHSPKVEVMLGRSAGKMPISKWDTHKIDDLPERAVFVTSADTDLDGDSDIIVGGFWYENPGTIDGKWELHEIGDPLKNMADVMDFDRDGDMDILGTEGIGSKSNHSFVWAENDGKGNFTLHKNIEYTGDGDFLQGCKTVSIHNQWHVILSWHDKESRLLALKVPANPAKSKWETIEISNQTLKEDVSFGDIDRDGDMDLLLGTVWLQSSDSSWEAFTVGEVPDGSEPDRNGLTDVDGDGRLDAIVSLENGTDVYWYKNPENSEKPWKRYTIGSVAGQGFSMDVADFDLDNDPDVVIGEHRGKTHNRVVIFENEGKASNWKMTEVDNQPRETIDHHDGTKAVDIDGDGDLDIISIGWYNPKLWIIENRASNQ